MARQLPGFVKRAPVLWAVVVAMVGVLLATTVIAAAQSDSETIYAAVNKSSGTMKIVSGPDAKLGGNEYLISWNQVGPAGPVGPQGERGLQGEPGAQGLKGEQGLQGEPGAQGVEGDPGPQGAPGATGAAGATGATGAQGPQGEPGASEHMAFGRVTTPFAGGAAPVNLPGFVPAGSVVLQQIAGQQGVSNPVVLPGNNGFTVTSNGAFTYMWIAMW